MKDMRVHPRFGPLVIKVRFLAGKETYQGYLTNISRGGAYLAVEEPPQLGTDIELVAFLPWRLGEFRTKARVVWRSESVTETGRKLAGVGLAFTHMDEEARKVLEAYLARFVELAARIEEM